MPAEECLKATRDLAKQIRRVTGLKSQFAETDTGTVIVFTHTGTTGLDLQLEPQHHGDDSTRMSIMIRVTCNGEFMHAYVSVSPEGDFTCIGEGGCGHSTDDFPDELSDMFDDQPHDADGVREEIERSVGVWLDYGNQTPSNLAYT